MNNDIWNLTCPVCGYVVPEAMALIELSSRTSGRYQSQEEQPGVRLCSIECAAVAMRSPEKYRTIAMASVRQDREAALVRPS